MADLIFSSWTLLLLLLALLFIGLLMNVCKHVGNKPKCPLRSKQVSRLTHPSDGPYRRSNTTATLAAVGKFAHMKVVTRLPVLLKTFGAWRKTPTSSRCPSHQTSPWQLLASLERILRKNGESRECKETETTDRMTKELKRMISSHCPKSHAMACWKKELKKASWNRKCSITKCWSQNAIRATKTVQQNKTKKHWSSSIHEDIPLLFLMMTKSLSRFSTTQCCCDFNRNKKNGLNHSWDLKFC